MSAAQRLDEIFGLPRGSAVIVLNDPETKVPLPSWTAHSSVRSAPAQ